MNYRQFFTNHQWWGKLCGAFFGYLIGGPGGALLGLLVGNLFDRGIFQHFTQPHWFYHAEKREQVQKVFFEATFSVMGHLAKADGRISEQEIELAKQLMDEMQLNRAKKTLAKKFFREGKDPSFNLANCLAALKENCSDNPELLKLFMDIQYRAAQTDGFSQLKLQALDSIFKHLGFAPLYQQHRFYEDLGPNYYSAKKDQHQHSHQQRRSYSSPPSSLTEAYSILEIGPTANKQEIKRAYRRLMSRNHPDKLIAQGLPEQMIKIANGKTQRIRKAYEQICASKGW